MFDTNIDWLAPLISTATELITQTFKMQNYLAIDISQDAESPLVTGSDEVSEFDELLKMVRDGVQCTVLID